MKQRTLVLGGDNMSIEAKAISDLLAIMSAGGAAQSILGRDGGSVTYIAICQAAPVVPFVNNGAIEAGHR